MANSRDTIKWTVGIITAPREKGYYLDQTLRSLNKAGFYESTVFAEPGSVVPEWFGGHIVERRKQYGDWTNWASGLYELFLSEPDTNYFFMLEDDALLCTGLRKYLEYAIPKLGDFASLSVYTPSRYHKSNRTRTFHNECQGKITWSTVTVIMPHNSVLRFFSDEDVQRHRFHDIFQVDDQFWRLKASYGRGRTSVTDTVGNTLKDAVIGLWAEKIKLPVYYHTPALAEHIGNYSTLTDDLSTTENGRMSADFVGEDFDVSNWVGENVRVMKFNHPPLA